MVPNDDDGHVGFLHPHRRHDKIVAHARVRMARIHQFVAQVQA
jgi:hypothetical protein